MAAKKGKPYTRIQLQYLREHYQLLTARQLAIAFNKQFHQERTRDAIKSVLTNHRITCGNNMAKGWTQQLLSPSELAWLTEHYDHVSIADIRLRFNRRFKRDITREQMKAAIARNKLKSGRSGWFKKGSTPSNKGVKHPPGWSPGRMAETQFKPGHSQTVASPIGSERITRDGYIVHKYDVINPHTGARGYYMEKHRQLWIEAHGEIPAKHIVTFIDDDRSNCVIENLECIPRGEQVRRNKLKYLEAPPGIRPSIKALAKLQHITGQRARNAH